MFYVSERWPNVLFLRKHDLQFMRVKKAEPEFPLCAEHLHKHSGAAPQWPECVLSETIHLSKDKTQFI